MQRKKVHLFRKQQEKVQSGPKDFHSVFSGFAVS